MCLKKKQWVQALVDQCTDVTETLYPTHGYGGFSKNQRQKVWQNKNGRSKNASPISPPASVTISELLSTVSMFQETIAMQIHLLAESESDHQPSLNDAASVDPNRNINRAGGAPGRGEQAHGDRE